jgi:ankyrin repeat protein
VRALDHDAALVLIDAGAGAGRRIELSARGERFTTILHEIVRLGRTVALERVLERGVDPSVLDSDAATPMHRLDGRSDHLNPEIVSALSAAGADVNSTTPGGQRPIEAAAQRILPATVAAVLELGADPREGADRAPELVDGERPLGRLPQGRGRERRGDPARRRCGRHPA